MIDKTIIDGVNVAECEYYKGKCMEYTHYCQIGCKECTDIGTKLCHYKQTERFKAKIARLEQENKELRQQYNCYACDTCQGKEDYRNMKRHCENAIKTVHTYRSALEEIQKATKSYDLTVDNGASVDTLYTIRKIINEVLK